VNRRTFLTALAGIPVVGRLIPKPKEISGKERLSYHVDRRCEKTLI